MDQQKWLGWARSNNPMVLYEFHVNWSQVELQRIRA